MPLSVYGRDIGSAQPVPAFTDVLEDYYISNSLWSFFTAIGRRAAVQCREIKRRALVTVVETITVG
jgi:hypothetical protein